MSLRRRWGANAGWLALLALLCAGAALLITASPRVANRYTDEGLREAITSLPYLARDINYLIDPRREPPLRPGQAQAYTAQVLNEFAPPLRERIDEYWYASQVVGAATGPDLIRTSQEQGVSGGFEITLRDQSGAQNAARVVDGTWPRNSTVIGDGVQAAVSTDVARVFGLRLGSRLQIGFGVSPDGTVSAPDEDGRRPLPVVIVGIFEPENRADPEWDAQPEAFDPYAPVGLDSPEPWRGVLFTDTEGLTLAAPRFDTVAISFRYRLDETAITFTDLPEVVDAVFDARTQGVVRAQTVTSLDTALSRFAERVRSASALLAVVQAGIGVTLFGLVVLAAIAATERRHGEFALLRARGASLPRIGSRLLVESGPVVALAVIAGSALGLLVPGRPGGTAWLVVAFAVAAALTAPVLGMVGHRRVAVSASRTDLARPRVSPRRITAELTLVAVAVLGVLLLRRRSLGTEVDIYLAALPALVAGAAAIVALRLLPFPLRLLAKAAARARGAVAFLGLARAGRGAPASAGPIAVLVVAVSVGTFCAAVAANVSAARDRVADLAVPGDVIVQGGRFPLATSAQFAAVPGVTAVAPLTVAPNQLVGGGLITQALSGTAVVVVDVEAFDRVLRASGRPNAIPDALRSAATGEAVPAVVTPDIAEALGPAVGGVSVQGRTVSFTVAEVAESFPGVSGFRRFVVLPRHALPGSDARLDPTAFLLAGTGLDPDVLRAIGDDAQRAWLSDVRGEPFEDALDQPTRVLTYAQVRAELESGGVDRVLNFTFGVGLGAGLLLALLAVGFAVATGARPRGQALSRLRTMGLAPGQGRRLLAYELLPLILLGALVGSAVGTALPVLLGPALGLSAFSDGGEVQFTLDPRLPGLAFGLVLVAVVVAMMVEASINRRARLGAVLRVGGEN